MLIAEQGTWVHTWSYLCHTCMQYLWLEFDPEIKKIHYYKYVLVNPVDVWRSMFVAVRFARKLCGLSPFAELNAHMSRHTLTHRHITRNPQYIKKINSQSNLYLSFFQSLKYCSKLILQLARRKMAGYVKQNTFLISFIYDKYNICTS